jgi:uncharacterized membrane protein YfcA
MDYFWLSVAAAVAGAINSVAGGGTLVTFPTLLWALGGGVNAQAAVLANTTSTVALWPGSLGGMWGYRREFLGTERWLRLLLLPSLVGGSLGAWLLVTLPAESFKRLVPWLILTATLLFLLQPWIARRTGIGRPHEAPSLAVTGAIIGFQFLVAVYGGYFGAGIGILMLSALAMTGLGDIHRMNALKTLFGTAINGLAVVIFVLDGQVAWKYVVPMALASILGGFLGAAGARRLNRNLVRLVVVAIGLSLAAYYFWRTYGTAAGPAAVESRQPE